MKRPDAWFASALALLSASVIATTACTGGPGPLPEDQTGGAERPTSPAEPAGPTSDDRDRDPGREGSDDGDRGRDDGDERDGG